MHLKTYRNEVVSYGGQYLSNKIGNTYSDAGGVNAGMNAYVLGVKDILVDKKTDVLFSIVHKSENGYRSGRNVKEALHIFSFCKGKSGGVYLGRKILGFKGLVSRHKKHIEFRFLSVAEKEILAH